jgi:hypothetical protein
MTILSGIVAEVEWAKQRRTGVTHAFKAHGRVPYCGQGERRSLRGWDDSASTATGICVACWRKVRRPTHVLAAFGVY